MSRHRGSFNAAASAFVARAGQFGDVPEIGGLIAPRHAVWEVGSRDGLIKPQWADEAIARMRQAYHALSADDRLFIDRFDGGHQWHGTVAYDVLARVLG